MRMSTRPGASARKFAVVTPAIAARISCSSIAPTIIPASISVGTETNRTTCSPSRTALRASAVCMLQVVLVLWLANVDLRPIDVVVFFLHLNKDFLGLLQVGLGDHDVDPIPRPGAQAGRVFIRLGANAVVCQSGDNNRGFGFAGNTGQGRCDFVWVAHAIILAAMIRGRQPDARCSVAGIARIRSLGTPATKSTTHLYTNKS